MRGLQVVGSMKDFYWDIRPKPEYGTIEIRVCDTPLTVEHAAALAAFAQALARWLVESGCRLTPPSSTACMASTASSPAASGWRPISSTPRTREKGPLKADLLRTLATVRNYASDDSGREAIDWLRGTVEQGASDSAWLREEYRRHGTLSDVVRGQCELWSASVRSAQ